MKTNPLPNPARCFVHARASLYTQTLFYFSFRSFQKHRRARERIGARERARLFSSSPTTSLHPAVYILSPALDGLGRENRGSVNRLCKSCLLDLRGCLHDTGATFAPRRVHSGSPSWLYICLHDTTTKSHAGASRPGMSSLRLSHRGENFTPVRNLATVSCKHETTTRFGLPVDWNG